MEKQPKPGSESPPEEPPKKAAEVEATPEAERPAENSEGPAENADLVSLRNVSLPPKISSKPVEKEELGKHHVGKLQQMQELQERHPRLRLLEAQIEGVSTGEVFVEDFLDFLEALFEAIEEERDQLRATYNSCEEFQEMFELQIDKAEAGYGYLLEALERIALFCEDEDDEHLKEGLVTYTKGGFLLFEIMDEMAEIEGEDENRLKM